MTMAAIAAHGSLAAMSDLHLEQIAVGRWRDSDVIYGLDKDGIVWLCEPNGTWHKMSMVKAEEETNVINPPSIT